jgi:hypothetical protein
MGFTALTIDVGMYLEDRRKLQNGADAAALAGVQYLPQQPDTAISTARQWAANNGIPSSEIQSVTVTTTSYANDTLTVRLNKSFGWIFGRVLGKTTSPVGATAGAVVGSLGGNNNMMPWALLEGDTNCLDANGDAIFGAMFRCRAIPAITGCYSALDFDGNGGFAEYQPTSSTAQTPRYCIAGDPSPGCVSAVPVVDALSGNRWADHTALTPDRRAGRPATQTAAGKTTSTGCSGQPLVPAYGCVQQPRLVFR